MVKLRQRSRRRADLLPIRFRSWLSVCGRYRLDEVQTPGEPKRFRASVRESKCWELIEETRFRKRERAIAAIERHARES